MNSPAPAFNLILALLFCSALGCRTPEQRAQDRGQQATFLRFHIETNPDNTGRTIPASVFRARPVLLTVDRNAVVDEGFLETVEIVDVDEHGGMALKVVFDEEGRRRLEAATIEHRGKHFAIMAVWTDQRWLAAPLITKRISNGEFVFTPDATREEMERLVNGLRNVIKELNKPYTF